MICNLCGEKIIPGEKYILENVYIMTASLSFGSVNCSNGQV